MTEALILFADAEQLLCDYLRPLLAPQPVGTRVPDPRPDRYIRLLRTGGVPPTIVTDGAQITVECWDRTEAGAVTTAAMARAILTAMPRRGIILAGHPVQGVEELSGPANLPDPLAPGQARYTFSLLVHLRGAAA